VAAQIEVVFGVKTLGGRRNIEGFRFSHCKEDGIRCGHHHFAVINLEAVAYSSYCNMMELFWWDLAYFSDQLASFSALTLLVGSSGLQKLSPK